eukprot:m.13018 g.13018  ORF g.13018 m.13018 type:complete len:724 (-) comp2779_c0_seq1:31-2202(-)
MAHAIQSANTNARMKRKEADEREAAADEPHLSKMSVQRRHALGVAMMFIQGNTAFRLINDPDWRCVLGQLVGDMSEKMLRRMLIEIYTAARATTVQMIGQAIRALPGLELFHLLIDLWKSESSQNYIGIRLCWVDDNYNWISKLVAVRAYTEPTTDDLQTQCASDLLKLWLGGVLQELGIKYENLASSTTDRGSDARRLTGSLIPCPADWCISQLLDYACVDAFGTTLDPKQSRNTEACELIMMAKKVIEHVNKSEPSKLALEEEMLTWMRNLALRSDVPQRWNSTANAIERLLMRFPAVRKVYSDKEKAFSLAAPGIHTSLVELYSIMRMFTESILLAQGEGTVVPDVLCELALLIRACDPSTPLTIVDPYEEDKALQAAKTARAEGRPAPPKYIPPRRVASDLQQVTGKTRKLAFDALRTRFCKEYVDNRIGCSKFFDACCYLFLPTRELPYVEDFVRCGLGAQVTADTIATISKEIRKLVEETVISLAIAVATAEDARRSPSGTGPHADVVVETASSSVVRRGFLALIATTDEPWSASAPLRTPEERARSELRQYAAIPKEEAATLTDCKKALLWWRRNEAMYPLLAAVARHVFGKPAGAGAIERDFHAADMIVMPTRNRFLAGFDEMSTFIRALPRSERPKLWTIPAMSRQEAADAFPKRFKTSQYKESLLSSEATLSSDDDDDAAGEHDDDDVERLLDDDAASGNALRKPAKKKKGGK